ncbi:unnamed protein product, partial [Sphagnum tenellum]
FLTISSCSLVLCLLSNLYLVLHLHILWYFQRSRALWKNLPTEYELLYAWNCIKAVPCHRDQVNVVWHCVSGPCQ